MSDSKKALGRWKRSMAGGGWIGVDLDGTLAHHGTWYGPYSIGAPIPRMVERVKRWLAAGITVKIVTARASDGDPAVVFAIKCWCKLHIGQELEVTCSKDYNMIQLWDDRAVQVVANTGERVDGAEEECCFDGLCPTCDPPPLACVSLHEALKVNAPNQCDECGLVVE